MKTKSNSWTQWSPFCVQRKFIFRLYHYHDLALAVSHGCGSWQIEKSTESSKVTEIIRGSFGAEFAFCRAQSISSSVRCSIPHLPPKGTPHLPLTLQGFILTLLSLPSPTRPWWRVKWTSLLRACDSSWITSGWCGPLYTLNSLALLHCYPSAWWLAPVTLSASMSSTFKDITCKNVV